MCANDLLLTNLGDKPRHTEPVDVHLILRRDGAAGPEVLLSRRAGQVYAAGLASPSRATWTARTRTSSPRSSARRGRRPAWPSPRLTSASPSRCTTAAPPAAPGSASSSRSGTGKEHPQVLEPAVCDAMDWYRLDDLPSPIVGAYCRAGLDAYRSGSQLAVHFQQPADPIPCTPRQTGSVRSPAPGTLARAGPTHRCESSPSGRSGASPTGRTCPGHDRAVGVAGAGAEGGVWFVKIHQNDRFHGRETGAYRSWVLTLGAAAPRLVAADPALRAIEQ